MRLAIANLRPSLQTLLGQALPPVVIGWVGLATGVFFLASTVRHGLFQSGVYDLGWFDQAVYLIAQGQPPIVSAVGFPVLGDHAAWILYPLAGLYRIYPSVLWLFAVQAIALGAGVLPLWGLSREVGLPEAQTKAVVGVYLLYPLLFNVNLFDFHPEVIALPLFLGAVLAVRRQQLGWFCLCLLLISGCKAVLALTIAAMGLWLLWSAQQRRYGQMALGWGMAWFLFSSQWLVPHFSGEQAAALGRYAYLGNSVLEIAANLFLKPGLVLGRLFSLATLEYLVLLLAPVIWLLSPRRLGPLLSAVPALMLNILSDSAAQRDLVHQYSIPVLPFLLLAVIASLQARETLLHRPRWIILWSLVGFVTLSKFGYFCSIYLQSLDTWSATRSAIALVHTQEPVLTTHEIAPHLAHRSRIEFTNEHRPPQNLAVFKFVLLNLKHPGFLSSPEFAQGLERQLSQDPQFRLVFSQDHVYLFEHR